MESITLSFFRSALHIAHDLIHMYVSSSTYLDTLPAEVMNCPVPPRMHVTVVIAHVVR
jgi:hypothetical protein